MASPGGQLMTSPGCVLRTADNIVQVRNLLSPDLPEDCCSVSSCSIVARVRVRETGAAAPGARTAAPRIWACPAWVRQVVETCSRDNLNT